MHPPCPKKQTELHKVQLKKACLRNVEILREIQILIMKSASKL